MTDVENKFRYQNELFCAMSLFGGPGRAGLRAWSAAQTGPTPPCRASLGPMTFGPGQNDGLWTVLTGLGCMPRYNGEPQGAPTPSH